MVIEATPTKAVLKETEAFDTYRNCPDAGTVTLNGDRVTYDYAGRDGTAQTTLVQY